LLPGLQDNNWMASCRPSWLVIVDVFHTESGVIDLLRSCCGTRNLDLASWRGHSMTCLQSQGIDQRRMVFSADSSDISAAAVSDHLLWTFVERSRAWCACYKIDRVKCTNVLPAEETTNTARGISDNSVPTAGSIRRTLEVLVNCRDARNIAEAQRCRTHYYHFESKNILPCHLNKSNK